MKIAIVHDWLTGMRGGEKCLEAICGLYPGASLYTLIHRPGHLTPAIEQMDIHTSWIQRLPLKRVYYRHLLPFFPRAVEGFDLSGYDLVISSSHCVAKGAVTGPATCHICYCYTPMRYAWDQYQQYFGPRRLRWWNRRIIPPLIDRLRTWDVSTTHRVNYFAAISDYVAGRIKKYYGREAAVIYPPVDLGGFHPRGTPGDYYLMVNALAPYKRVDLAVEAFNKLGRDLRIVGTGLEEARLRRAAGNNIRFLGWLSRQELAEAYAGCRALIFPGEEDFGIVPLEAHASGRPVIAFGSGGVTESVRPYPDFPMPGAWPGAGDSPTGIFFAPQSVEALLEAVRFFEEHHRDFSPDVIRESVSRFDLPRFLTQFSQFVEEKASAFTGGA